MGFLICDNRCVLSNGGGAFPNSLPSLRGAGTYPRPQKEVYAHSATEEKALTSHFSNFSRPLETEALFKREKEDLKGEREREREAEEKKWGIE